MFDILFVRAMFLLAHTYVGTPCTSVCVCVCVCVSVIVPSRVFV